MDLARELTGILAPDRVLSRRIDRIAWANDASVYRLVPRVVVQPESVTRWHRKGFRLYWRFRSRRRPGRPRIRWQLEENDPDATRLYQTLVSHNHTLGTTPSDA